MTRPTPLREGLAVWTASIVLMGALGLAGLAVPWIDANLGGFVAVVFLYLPTWVIRRYGEDLPDYGLGGERLARDVAVGLAVTAVVFPIYLAGHWAFHTQVLHRELALDGETFRRFDRDLEGRPERRDARPAVWIENDWLRIEPGAAPATARVETTPGPARVLRSGRSVTGEVSLAPGSLPLLVDLRGREALRVELTPPEAALGAYGVTATAPLETSRGSWWWLSLLAIQVILVALPEEWFYRGYLQARLDAAWAPRWRILGASLGPAWLVSSALFALGHLVLDARPARLLVFFPSLLFGWIRARTGSVIPGALFHAACNVLATALAYAYR